MGIPTWTSGEVLVASDVNSWFVPLAAYKASLTTYSSTTLADDSDLQVSMAANSIYSVDITLFYDTAAATDVAMKIGAYGPASVAFSLTSVGSILSGQTTSPGLLTQSSASGVLHTPGGGSVTIGAVLGGIVTTSSTAGTFGLEFAEDTASNPVSVLANSRLIAWRIA